MSAAGAIQDVAVSVRSASKSYKSGSERQIVLDKLNMTVRIGQIYGLLGASECGKTTLLKCITGRQTLDSGDILIFGHHSVAGATTYMPQEVGLFEELSIMETFQYFGWISGMKTKEIEEKCDFLLRALQLPYYDTPIKNLSEGGKRRVSLAICFLDQPKLVILDEPTASLDSVMRERTWDFLLTEAMENGVTIIITTHYVDEAKRAMNVGMMRNGKLMAEKPPRDLLESLECASLGEAILKLSVIQENHELAAVVNSNEEKLEPKEQVLDRNEREILARKNRTFLLKARKMNALIWRNTINTSRSFSTILLLLFFTATLAAIYTNCIGTNLNDLQLSVVNREHPGELFCQYNRTCEPYGISCRFLDKLRRTKLILVSHTDVSSAINSVRGGRAWGVLQFHKNFSDSFFKRMELGRFAGDNVLQGGEIGIKLDFSSMPVGYSIIYYIFTAYEHFAEGLAEDCGIGLSLFFPPLSFEKPVFGSKQLKYHEFTTPAFMLIAIFILMTILNLGSIQSQRTDGTFERSLLLGITDCELLISHFLVQLIIVCCESFLIILLTVFVFKSENIGSLSIVYLFSCLAGILGLCWGLFITTIARNERISMYGAIGSFIPLICISDAFWPIKGMPEILRWFSETLPLTSAIQSLRSVMVRGWGLDHPLIYTRLISILIWIGIGLIGCAYAVKLKKV